MQLIIIRHGRPERIEGAAGAADPDLTDIGVQQAQEMAAWLRHEGVDAIYTSPMRRARQTSTPLEEAMQMEAVVADGVREFDAEDNSYIPVEELRADKERWREFIAYEAEGNRAAFFAEVNETLAGITSRHRGQTVAVVCHGGVINAYAADVLGLAPRMFFNPDYTSINRFMVASSGERSIRSLNDTGHLRPHPHLNLG